VAPTSTGYEVVIDWPMAFVAVAETLVFPGDVKVNVACSPVSPSLQVTVADSLTVAVNTDAPTGGHWGPLIVIVGGIDVAVVVVVSVTGTDVVVAASVLGGAVSVEVGVPIPPTLAALLGVLPFEPVLGGDDPWCEPLPFVAAGACVPFPLAPVDALVVSPVVVVGCFVWCVRARVVVASTSPAAGFVVPAAAPSTRAWCAERALTPSAAAVPTTASTATTNAQTALTRRWRARSRVRAPIRRARSRSGVYCSPSSVRSWRSRSSKSPIGVSDQSAQLAERTRAP
jgi:hypothetical protein